MARTRRRRVNVLAISAGAIRLASGVSFLVAPEAANRWWGDDEDSGPTASLLLRSMGYRDALIGGLLLWSGLRGSPTATGLVPRVGRGRRRGSRRRDREPGPHEHPDSRCGGSAAPPWASGSGCSARCVRSGADHGERPRRHGSALLSARRIRVRRALPQPGARTRGLVGLARGRDRSVRQGQETNAETFFAGLDVHALDSTDAVRPFEAGGDAIAAPSPMHPSYEDRADVPDVIFASVPPELAGHLAAVWEEPFRAAGADARRPVPPPPPDAAARPRPGPVARRPPGRASPRDRDEDDRRDPRPGSRSPARLGHTLATMPEDVTDLAAATDLDAVEREMLGDDALGRVAPRRVLGRAPPRAGAARGSPHRGVAAEPGECDLVVRPRPRPRHRAAQRRGHRALQAALACRRAVAATRSAASWSTTRTDGPRPARRERWRTPRPISTGCSARTTTRRCCSSSVGSSASSASPR